MWAALIAASGSLAGIGFLAGWTDWLPNPVLYLRGRLSGILVWGGAALLIFASGHIALVSRSKRRMDQALLEVREDMDRNRRRFLQRLDHELKNPLTAIRAGLTNIRSEPLQEYPASEAAAVESQVLRISQLVADLRKVAALEEMVLERTPVDTASLLEEIVESVREQRDLAGRELLLVTPSAPWPLPEIRGDPDLLVLAVHNLIDNALKFTRPGDTVEVRAQEQGAYVSIEVADTGQGIPASEQIRVWEELYRGTQAQNVPGSGLGLSLVHAIVDMHGGYVDLLSKPDQGSVFSLFLPVN